MKYLAKRCLYTGLMHYFCFTSANSHNMDIHMYLSIYMDI